jgi:hypothetical protein
MNTSNRLPQSLRWLTLAQLCLLLGTSHAFAQAAAAPSAAEKANDENKKPMPVVTTDATAATDTAPDKEVVTLSPFEVVANTKGYYSANTMSGTRFNSKLDDLAASVSVMTKEQMSDFAMLDINDVFLYVAGAEGTGTYSAVTVDRNGSISDGVQLDPANANRIRGLANANISFGNYETMGRVPVDPINIDSIEVSRGPNANVFGLGQPSGTLNQVPAAANVIRDRSFVQFRADSYDGYRTALDLNRVLLKGKLAVRFSAVNQHDGFMRKPSGVDTERYNGMIKYQPFKNTTITGSLSYYHSYGNRPNSTPPRDGISYWLASGKPTWDPVTQTIHVNGTTLGPFSATTYNGPDYFNNAFTGNNHSYLFIDQNGIGLFSAPSGFTNTTVLAGATTAGPTSAATVVRFMSPTAGTGISLGRSAVQPLFTTTPSVNNKALYDWESVNLAAVNYDWDTMLTTNVGLDQVFFNTPRQLLVGQLGWLREDSQRYRRDYVGIANDNGQSGQLLIDVNERLLDGTPNPYFLRPYIGQDQPRTTYQPAKWDTYRAQLAYKLDLTQEKGWLKYLGLHTLTGYNEYKYRINRRYSYREAMLDQKTWIPAGLSRGNQSATTNPITAASAAALAITRSYLRYYVGDNQGNNVDYAPTDLKQGVYNFVWGNTTTGVFNREPTLVGLAAVTDASGGGSNSKVILKTTGGVWQSHYLDDRIVTTFGLRQDEQDFQAGGTPTYLNADGTTFNYASLDHWNPNVRVLKGKTKQGGVVVRPFRDTKFVNRMGEGAGASHFFANLLNGLSCTYNKSDSFIPQNPVINLQQVNLPNPTGQGKDYGFGLNMFDGKLVVRFNHYDTMQLNKSGGDAGTIAQRVTRIDLTSTAVFLLTTQAAGTVAAPGWIRAQNPGFSEAQVQAELARQIGVTTDLQTAIIQEFNAGTLSSTQDQRSKGNEIEINYNPSKNWTVSASGTDTQAINTNVSTDIKTWIDSRMPIWTTIKDPRGPDHILNTADDAPVNWWTTNYGGSQTPQQNYIAFVQTPFSVVSQLEGKSNPQVGRYATKISTNYKLAGISDNKTLKKISVGGAWRWESKKAIGYYGVADANGIYQSLDVNNPINYKAQNYFDGFVSYKTSLWSNKIRATFQLNVRNIQENGKLQPIAADPNGNPNTYRIVDPRQFILTASFDL